MTNSTISRLPMKLISEVGEVFTGSTPSTSDRTLYGDEYPFFGPSDLDKGKYLYSAEKNLSNKGFAYSRKIPANAILFACIGIIGKIGIAKRDSSCNQQINYIIPKSGIDYQYLYYALQFVAPIIRDNATTQVVPMINKSEFEKFEVPIPDYEEQKVIAKALSDIDELIANLKLEIAKTQNVKEAVCRPLVLGDTRLNGFTSKWVQRVLGDELGYEQPTKYLVNTTEHQETGKIPVLTAGKSFILGYSDDTEGVYTNTPTILFDDFTTDSKFVDFDFKVKSSACKMIKNTNSKGSLRFFHTLMQYLEFRPYDHKRYWISEYSKLEILVPEPIEQNAIAAIVEDFENQIKLLKSELAKYECIKQGMAHDLLTGKVRLV